MQPHIREQLLRIRVGLLEDAIIMHRRIVRDGWRSPWRPDLDPNAYLWRLIDE